MCGDVLLCVNCECLLMVALVVVMCGVTPCGHVCDVCVYCVCVFVILVVLLCVMCGGYVCIVVVLCMWC